MKKGKVLEGNRVRISSLRLEDALLMRNWGKHENPFFEDYNFPYIDEEEIEEWYRAKTFGKSRKYFSVYNEEEKPIGYIGIKHIKRLKKEATLGIVFDPCYMDKGYGTETITIFLRYFFNELKMNILILEVANFNKRAIRCYEKCGFVKTGEYLQRYLDQSIDESNPYFEKYRNFFVRKHEKIYNYIYKMKIDKKMYYETREKSD